MAKNDPTSPLERVLVALDGSDGAQRALAFAIGLNRQYSSELVLCTALDHAREIAEASMPDFVSPSIAQSIERYDEAAKLLLNSASSRALALGASVSTMLLEGSPAAAILECATARKVDAIVMGTEGKQGLERAFAGSTAEGVLRFANVPTIVIHRPSDAPHDPAKPAETGATAGKTIARILVALDDSDPSDAAFAFALLLAADESVLLCCNVIETGQLVDNAAIYGCDPAPYVDEAREAALALLEKNTARASPQKRPLERIILEGSAADAILKTASDRQVDLIVCGTHGRRGLGRMFLGSVAESIVRRSSIPVAVVRTKSGRAANA